MVQNGNRKSDWLNVFFVGWSSPYKPTEISKNRRNKVIELKIDLYSKL